MEISECVADHKIALLIDLSGLIEEGNCDGNETKTSEFSLSFKVLKNPYFTHFEIEENKDETFDLIFYLEGRNGLDIVDLETDIPKKILEKNRIRKGFGYLKPKKENHSPDRDFLVST